MAVVPNLLIACFFLATGVHGWSGFHVLTDRADAAYMHRLAAATGADAALQWVRNSDPCNDTWRGVTCNGDGRVVGIDVHGCGLGGWVPGNDNANASSLARLRELDLGDNNLGGPLPVLALPQLQRLNLRANAFKTIPERFFLHMKQLEHFSVGNNTWLEPWSLPADLRLLAELETFEANNARINGTLAGFLGYSTAFPDLRNISLANNHLVGPVPASFASGTISSLDLSNNTLSGSISFIDNLSGLSVFRLDRNNFTGPLPALDGLLLQVFSVAHNRLTGLVPPPPPRMPADMEMVSLAGNLLQGPVPQFATTVQNDVAEAAATGSFCRLGPGPCDPDVTSLLAIAAALHFPEVLARSWKRNDACLGWLGGHYGGEEDTDNGGRRRVKGINLSRLGLNGTMDPAFASLVSLRFISLSGNNISGGVPPAIASQLPSLGVLDVSDNALAGKLPRFRRDVEVCAERNPALNISSFSPPGISGHQRSGLAIAAVAVLVLICFF